MKITSLMGYAWSWKRAAISGAVVERHSSSPAAWCPSRSMVAGSELAAARPCDSLMARVSRFRHAA
jgi:hypothetical protein